MCVGCIDDSMFKSKLNYLPVKETELWQVQCDGMVIGNTLIKGTKMLAAFDTGSALIKVPTLVAQHLVKHLPGSSKLRSDRTITMPCNSNSMGSFGFSFGGQTYKIPLVDLQMGIYDEAHPGQCTFGIFADDRFQKLGRRIDGYPRGIVPQDSLSGLQLFETRSSFGWDRAFEGS
ncbi:hypothetical protein, variant, partial [Microbotryum lychnidis-dioicae p1A1 Lamole]